MPRPAGNLHVVAGWLSGQGHHFMGDDCSRGVVRRSESESSGWAVGPWSRNVGVEGRLAQGEGSRKAPRVPRVGVGVRRAGGAGGGPGTLSGSRPHRHAERGAQHRGAHHRRGCAEPACVPCGCWTSRTKRYQRAPAPVCRRCGHHPTADHGRCAAGRRPGEPCLAWGPLSPLAPFPHT